MISFSAIVTRPRTVPLSDFNQALGLEVELQLGSHQQ